MARIAIVHLGSSRRDRTFEMVLEPTASTTAENAARTLPFVIERKIEDVVVVCTPLHV